MKYDSYHAFNTRIDDNFRRFTSHMSKRVYIVDLIGNHSGMHYYHEAFSAQFSDQDDVEVSALSNYNAINSRKFFPYLYSGSTLSKIMKVIYCWFKLALFMIRNRNCFFVYEFFGRKLDLLFLPLRKLAKDRFILDIHDLYDISTADQTLNTKIDRKIIQLKKVIIHSEKVAGQLKGLNYPGSMVQVPHFHYVELPQTTNTSEEIDRLFDEQRTNLLFFGHIRRSKGIKELTSLFNNIMSEELLNKVHLIIAGNDPDQLCEKFPLNASVSHAMLLRKISDEELDQLFTQADGVLLPYIEISQSGVLEMAIKYRKPLLCSNLVFFKDYLADYQSFGVLFNIKEQGSFEKSLQNMLNSISEFYLEKDVNKYQNDDSFDNFKKEFKTLLEV